jgi:ribose-phosphate pyrophosphokinase
MRKKMQVYHNKIGYRIHRFTFPGGEQQVSIPDLPKGFLKGDVTVLLRVQSASDLVTLLLLTEILRRRVASDTKLRLILPYFPFARQDRVMDHNESFSLKAIARVINSLGYDRVMTLDLHSPVTDAIVDNVMEFTSQTIIEQYAKVKSLIETTPDLVLISPDAGAAKKVQAIAKEYTLPGAIGMKLRDIKTGDITGLDLLNSDFISGRPCLIIDDICDGGRNFTTLADVLHLNGASDVKLYVTHGIFSKGLTPFRGLISDIYTTDSFVPILPPEPAPGVNLHIFDITEKLLSASTR